MVVQVGFNTGEIRRPCLETRQTWDFQFQGQRDIFAAEVAKEIADSTLRKLQKELEDPYQGNFVYRNFRWSLSPLNASEFDKTWEELPYQAKLREPFMSWKNHLVVKEANGHYKSVPAENKYFNEKMVEICNLALPKLKELFDAMTAAPNCDIRFRVHIERSGGSSGCCGGGSSKVTLYPQINVFVEKKEAPKPDVRQDPAPKATSRWIFAAFVMIVMVCISVLMRNKGPRINIPFIPFFRT